MHSTSVATDTSAPRLADHCDMDDFFHSCKDATLTIDLLRRTVRMLLDGSIQPLEAYVVTYASSISSECRTLEDAMTSCLADTTLERFVNSNGVAQMIRDTTRRWCSGAGSSHKAGTEALNTTQRAGLMDMGERNEMGAIRASAVRVSLVNALEDGLMRIALAPTPVKVTADRSIDDQVHKSTQATQMGILVERIRQCAEAALSGAIEASRSTGTIVNVAPAVSPASASRLLEHRSGTEPFREYSSEIPSPTFALQSQCAELMSELRRGLVSDPKDPPRMPPFGLAATQSLLSLLLSLQSTVSSTRNVAIEAMELLAWYPQAAGAKVAELREMVKWYQMSSQAAKEWRRESARREVARQTVHQRTQAMQKELNRLVDEESLLRSTFANRWAPYLPKGGFPQLHETPGPIRVSSVSSFDGGDSEMGTTKDQFSISRR